ncbi:DUF6538 domain-containing protein [Paraburkholderia sp. 31.1]|uniref:DUF6538 domain-containing protein n=1 Tax=Paraburkholderia sp. 31.1 TaxID=2615205 RepID=UPI003975BF57
MPIKTPRLHRDRKSVGYFFRYKLPAILAERLGKVSVYQSLKTKDFTVAKARALYLNLQLEMTRHKLDPNKAYVRICRKTAYWSGTNVYLHRLRNWRAGGAPPWFFRLKLSH